MTKKETMPIYFEQVFLNFHKKKCINYKELYITKNNFIRIYKKKVKNI